MNYKKMAFGCPSLLSAAFTLLITFEYYTGFLPDLYEVRNKYLKLKI